MPRYCFSLPHWSGLFDVDESAFCGLLKNAERADHFQAAPRGFPTAVSVVDKSPVRLQFEGQRDRRRLSPTKLPAPVCVGSWTVSHSGGLLAHVPTACGLLGCKSSLITADGAYTRPKIAGST